MGWIVPPYFFLFPSLCKHGRHCMVSTLKVPQIQENIYCMKLLNKSTCLADLTTAFPKNPQLIFSCILIQKMYQFHPLYTKILFRYTSSTLMTICIDYQVSGNKIKMSSWINFLVFILYFMGCNGWNMLTSRHRFH